MKTKALYRKTIIEDILEKEHERDKRNLLMCGITILGVFLLLMIFGGELTSGETLNKIHYSNEIENTRNIRKYLIEEDNNLTIINNLDTFYKEFFLFTCFNKLQYSIVFTPNDVTFNPNNILNDFAFIDSMEQYCLKDLNTRILISEPLPRYIGIYELNQINLQEYPLLVNLSLELINKSRKDTAMIKSIHPTKVAEFSINPIGTKTSTRNKSILIIHNNTNRKSSIYIKLPSILLRKTTHCDPTNLENCILLKISLPMRPDKMYFKNFCFKSINGWF